MFVVFWVYIYKLQNKRIQAKVPIILQYLCGKVEGTWNHHLVINTLNHQGNSWVIDTIHQAVADWICTKDYSSLVQVWLISSPIPVGFCFPLVSRYSWGLNGHFKQEDYDYELGQEIDSEWRSLRSCLLHSRSESCQSFLKFSPQLKWQMEWSFSDEPL